MTYPHAHAASRRGGALRSATLACGLLAGAGSLAEAAERTHAADGIASFYGRSEHGGPTASGERFDMHKLTAAHRTLPMGSRVTVTNLANGRSVTVRINDRGPFVRGRVIDLSQAAAGEIGMIGSGLARVRIATAEAVAPAGDAEPATTGSIRRPAGKLDRPALSAAPKAAETATPTETAAAPADGRIRLSERDRLLIERTAAVD